MKEDYPNDLQGAVFSWKRLLIILAAFILGLLVFSCQKDDDPLPYYEVVPVVEITNPFFNDIENVRLSITLKVDGVSTTQEWDIPFKRVRFGCNLIKWVGTPVEYQVPTLLELKVEILYKINGSFGYVPLQNFSDEYLPKAATWIRPFFEVREAGRPNNKFIGIETHNNPSEGIYQAPTVVWQVTIDPNFMPSQASPTENSNLRIAYPDECEECIWTQVK